MNLGERLYRERRKLGLSQENLANQIDVSRQAVSKWEQGASSPDLNNLVALSKALNVSIDYLLGVDKTSPKSNGSQFKSTPLDDIFLLIKFNWNKLGLVLASFGSFIVIINLLLINKIKNDMFIFEEPARGQFLQATKFSGFYIIVIMGLTLSIGGLVFYFLGKKYIKK